MLAYSSRFGGWCWGDFFSDCGPEGAGVASAHKRQGHPVGGNSKVPLVPGSHRLILSPYPPGLLAPSPFSFLLFLFFASSIQLLVVDLGFHPQCLVEPYNVSRLRPHRADSRQAPLLDMYMLQAYRIRTFESEF